ncbi:methylenetetrahydrofolate reductase C-terminal domain-containing protein [Microbacterium sp. SORGH_AS_0888]|uniref:methylenetetrahydrofolate reductase C-terminal domain-containing protein n=1 Tax=Microbacterium sp. SORGH_AS_0888 TaxID=3041791 RepID=UPI002782C656|nr:methylenetetrahydrofolate reductase C-terminal domain-containing protein [Microbacterium sp. SORGH_AS_0888]MDQ1131271.1 methylenetetrahydrofolate reductase (NADPH) [Microbacterium sp. SORGH_AS_0888]
MTGPATLPLRGECPKSMMYGPCGDVHSDGRCEISSSPCVFLGTATVAWPAPGDDAVDRSGSAAAAIATEAGRELQALMSRRKAVITGLPARAMDVDSLAACAEVLAGSVDAVLSGDSGRARVQFAPSYRAELIRRAGLRAWLGINCRDRNRVAIEGELAGVLASDAAGVLCVTGNHTDSGHRPDAQPVFDLEGTRVVPLARRFGLFTGAAASPAAPPTRRRAARFAQKVRAGAQIGLLQYAGEPWQVAEFIDEVRAEGADVPFLPGVPVVIDHEGAALLASFESADLPAGYVQRVLDARDPFTAGIEAAVDYGRGLLELDGVAGVVAAGGARFGQEREFSLALATIARELGGAS